MSRKTRSMRRSMTAVIAGAWVLALLAPPPSLQIQVERGSAPIPEVSDMRAIFASGRSAPIGLEARVSDYTGAAVTETEYPVINANGSSAGSQKWRIITGTGNCCENYLSSTSTGRLFDFGGDYLYFSDDEGTSWRRVAPADPLPNFGEGAVAVAPGGDIVGVAWNPYYGDRLVPFKYEAEEETWYYTTTKLHQPFFDRESLAALPGPFTFAGNTYPYVVLLKGGWPSKDPWFVSFDGLNYFLPSSKVADQIAQLPTTGWLDFEGTPEHDWLQATYQTRLAPLGKGQAISGYKGDNLSQQWGLLKSNLRWSAFNFASETLPGNGNMLTDSQGRLHYVYATTELIGYMMSVDGGRTWITRTIPLPEGSVGLPSIDFRANGMLGITAIAAHVHGEGGVSQDYVYKFSTARNKMRRLKTYLVGDGKLVTGVGVTSTDPRFDFSTITLLPDGRVALSFIDGQYKTPTLAIEQR